MSSTEFKNRSITFGLDSENSNFIPVLRLLYSLPRLYTDLAFSWEYIYPGTTNNLKYLQKLNFLDYQPSIILDTINNKISPTISKPVSRYKLTKLGKKLYNESRYDIRILNDTFFRMTDDVSFKVFKIFEILNINDEDTKFGTSAPYLISSTKMPERTLRWWIAHLLSLKYIYKLDTKYSDTREIIPAHYRVNKKLSNQLINIFNAFPTHNNKVLGKQLKLNRNKYLTDINVSQIVTSRDADFAHDIGAQKALSVIIKSPIFLKENLFNIEPRIGLTADTNRYPWEFSLNIKSGTKNVFYQPDAEFREKNLINKTPVRSVLEYERFQTRRDSWSHIEKFSGWMYQMSLPNETGVLRFIVDSESKARAYVELIEAYADYVLDNPLKGPRNDIVLAVSTTARISFGSDPLTNNLWYRVSIKGNNDATPVIHSEKDSPYNLYFSRGRK